MNRHRLGLIGFPLKNTFSVEYMGAKIKAAGLPWTYENIEVSEAEALPQLLGKDSVWSGFNVTRPHKKAVANLLTELSDEARLCGAVNCVVKQANGIWKGYNTDITGFSRSLRNFIGPNPDRQALIVGTGGAAMAAAVALKLMGIPYLIAGRNINALESAVALNHLDAQLIKDYTLIIQCTPVGMYPDSDALLPFPYDALTAQHAVYDMIYLPAETSFMREARARSARAQNGLEMLHFQADDAFKIWTDALT